MVTFSLDRSPPGGLLILSMGDGDMRMGVEELCSGCFVMEILFPVSSPVEPEGGVTTLLDILWVLLRLDASTTATQLDMLEVHVDISAVGLLDSLVSFRSSKSSTSKKSILWHIPIAHNLLKHDTSGDPKVIRNVGFRFELVSNG